MVFNLALRQAEGFLRSLCAQLELDMPIPDHSTLSRRAKKLGRLPLAAVPSAGPIHLVIDSTGLRVHTGNRRKPPDQRLWRKLHIAVDESTRASHCGGAHRERQSRQPARRQAAQAQRARARLVHGRRPYDTETVYEAVAQNAERQGRVMPRVLIPPRKGAQLTCPPSPAMKQRNRNLRAIGGEGRRAWHKTSSYSWRSRVENVNDRYKATFGPGMRAWSLAGQRLEARLGCRILNRMAQLGMQTVWSPSESVGRAGDLSLFGEPCNNAGPTLSSPTAGAPALCHRADTCQAR